MRVKFLKWCFFVLSTIGINAVLLPRPFPSGPLLHLFAHVSFISLSALALKIVVSFSSKAYPVLLVFLVRIQLPGARSFSLPVRPSIHTHPYTRDLHTFPYTIMLSLPNPQPKLPTQTPTTNSLPKHTLLLLIVPTTPVLPPQV